MSLLVTSPKEITNIQGYYGRKKYKIACKAWFTASGEITPLSFKFKGDDGDIQLVSKIDILSVDENLSLGVHIKKYDCNIVLRDVQYKVSLVYWAEASQWMMVV